jgi:hypothetical protein
MMGEKSSSCYPMGNDHECHTQYFFTQIVTNQATLTHSVCESRDRQRLELVYCPCNFCSEGVLTSDVKSVCRSCYYS